MSINYHLYKIGKLLAKTLCYESSMDVTKKLSKK